MNHIYNTTRIKKWLTTTLLLTVPFFLTGCSLPGGSPGTTSQSQTTLTIWRVKNGEPAFETIVASFKAANPTIKINYRTFEPTDDYEGTVVNALAAGKGPDIWEIRNDELIRHKEKLIGQPVSAGEQEILKKTFAPVILEEMVSDDRLYGLPMGLDPLVLFINKEHMQKAEVTNLPKTWEETRELGQKLTVKANNIILRGGLALGTVSNIDRASQIVQLVLLQAMDQLGGQMTDPAHRKATFHLYTQNPETKQSEYPGVAGMSVYASFADDRSGFAKTWDAQQPYTTLAFSQGDLSMMINYLSLIPQLQKLDSKLPFTIGPVPQSVIKRVPREDIPASISRPVYMAKYQSLVVSKPAVTLNKSQQEARAKLAWRFVLFATQRKAAAAFSSSAGLISPFLTNDTSNATGQLANLINPYLKTWYKGPSPRTVDSYIGQMTKIITEQQGQVDTLLNEGADAISQILQ
jgi:ABC-type glycerol-3-phosphate transport system substrate-binding protein